jgi:hypothetical protein
MIILFICHDIQVYLSCYKIENDRIKNKDTKFSYFRYKIKNKKLKQNTAFLSFDLLN